MADALLVLNAGSSSLKYSVFARSMGLPLLLRGSISSLNHKPRMKVVDGRGHIECDIQLEQNSIAIADAMNMIVADLRRRPSMVITMIVHRIVHGGQDFSSATLLDIDSVQRLWQLAPLAPMHQPRNLEIVEAAQGAWPDARHYGCFDTAFHHDRPRLAKLYGLPRELTESGIISYGFHGVSFAYIASQLKSRYGTRAGGRTIVAHLGSGASLCAMNEGVSVATTMGFSPLDGLLMSTRCGSLDPGVFIHLIQHRGMNVEHVSSLLESESGMLGVSGISGDMHTLTESRDTAAQEAVDLFVYRIACQLGAMAATLQGLDTLVFCAGIGENSPLIRQRIGATADWLGVKIDPQKNWRADEDIGSPASAAKVLVIPTDEERAIAELASEL